MEGEEKEKRGSVRDLCRLTWTGRRGEEECPGAQTASFEGGKRAGVCMRV